MQVPDTWPTPFEFKMLGGTSPWWRQYVYYRLDWKKASGALCRITLHKKEKTWLRDRIDGSFIVAGANLLLLRTIAQPSAPG